MFLSRALYIPALSALARHQSGLMEMVSSYSVCSQAAPSDMMGWSWLLVVLEFPNNIGGV